MAMIKCKECGADISSQASACPKCGAPPPKRTSPLTWAVAAILIPSCAIGLFSGNEESKRKTAVEAAKTTEQRNAEALAKQRTEAEFQRAVLLAKTVKASLKNPDSFKLSNAIRTSAGAVCLEYRATNSFNAVVPGYAVQAPDGKAAAGSQEQVAALWNKHCASQAGHDIIYIRQAL